MTAVVRKDRLLQLLLLAACMAACGHVAHEVHWSYVGKTGPEHWADLSPDYANARTGRAQSPIDLGVSGDAASGAKLTFYYQPADGSVRDTGHSIQVDDTSGGHVMLDGERFELLQFHFHAPSEHTLSGRSYPLEAHLVHRNASGELLVVGVFVEPGPGSGLLATIAGKIGDAGGIRVDASELLPANRIRFRYMGSLTTPPCTEGVRWFVMRTPIRAPQDVISGFEAAYTRNNRPIQPLFGRRVSLEK